MKKFIIFLIILSVLIIQCSNEYSGESKKSEIEFIEDDADNFVYEEVETNIIKTNETKTTSKENKISEIKTNEIKSTNESKENKANENSEIKNANETIGENQINDAEKMVYIAKTGKKYHLENCRTLRGEKEGVIFYNINYI